MTMEAAFPRGGRESRPKPPDPETENKSGKYNKRKSEKADESSDFLFGRPSDEAKKQKTTTTSKSSKASKQAGSKKNSLMQVGGGGVVFHQQGKKQETIIEALSFSKLGKGTKLFGTIREVHDEFAVVSLPNLLTGYILKETAPLSCCLSVGQSLAVVVVKIVTEHIKGGQRRRVQVSPKPSLLNSRDVPTSTYPIRGQILSVEDHGCLVDLGFSRRGFLPFGSIEGEHTVLEADEDVNSRNDVTGTVLQTGRVYDFFVKPSKNDVVVPLSLPAIKTRAKFMPASTSPPPLSTICPGWLVQAKVDALAKNGLCVTFFGEAFRGAVELSHIGANFVPSDRSESTEWRDIFGKHQSFTARVLAVDVNTKLIRLSLQPHLLAMQVPKGLPPVGSLVKECSVIRIDPGIGALLALPPTYSKPAMSTKLNRDLSSLETYGDAAKVAAVYVHISKAIDEKDAQLFTKQFAPSTVHDVRILSTMNLVEGFASGACAKSLVDAHVLTHADLKPGQVYKQVPICAQLDGGSILVNLGSDVRGLIPPLHLFETSADSEFRRKLLKAKFAVDAKIDVRVLWVDVERKKCLLTAKKGLVQDETDSIVSYEDIELGQKVVGYISKIDDRGLSVTFCNRVYGRVTSKSLARELGIDDHRENYNVGDVVSCRVLNRKCRVQSNRTSSHHQSQQEEGEDGDEEDEIQSFWEVTLSMAVNDVDSAGRKHGDVSPKPVQLKPGSILPAKSMKIIELVDGKEKAKGGFIPGHAIVSIKSKYLLEKEETSSMPAYMECKLPYDQLMDDYSMSDIESVEKMNELAESLLTVGKKINEKGLILTDPRKLDVEYTSGVGGLVVISLRKKLISCVEESDQKEADAGRPILPNPNSSLYNGALLQGYVAQVDSRHGAFVRFLDGLTGLVPKTKGGAELLMYSTLITRVVTVDTSKTPMKILLEYSSSSKARGKDRLSVCPLKAGDVVDKLKVIKLDFHRATLSPVLPDGFEECKMEIHVTMKKSQVFSSKDLLAKNLSKRKASKDSGALKITKDHPFYSWKLGKVVEDLVVSKVVRERKAFKVELTDWVEGNDVFRSSKAANQLQDGSSIDAIISGVAKSNRGVYVQVNPTLQAFIPSLEFADDADVLNKLDGSVQIGARVKCRVLGGDRKRTGKKKEGKANVAAASSLYLSCLDVQEGQDTNTESIRFKPVHGDLVIGRINKSAHSLLPPSLMLQLRGGYSARCCISELDEPDDWANMPLGKMDQPTHAAKDSRPSEGGKSTKADENGRENGKKEGTQQTVSDNGVYSDGKYVSCRVLKHVHGETTVEVSLRPTRIDGDVDDDPLPATGDIVHGFVVHTDKKGCFIRLSRRIQGRVILKELCDGFLPNPPASFPMGRLIAGKVKSIREAPKRTKKSKDPTRHLVDIDMRESVVLDSDANLSYDDVSIGQKYKGTVTRVETFGVFIRLENSNVSGLAHKSECSDNFVRNVEDLYDPGDLVKVMVVKKEDEGQRIGFSLKPSHFADDDDSDDESSAMEVDSVDGSAASMEEDDEMDVKDDLDSDDENFASKLAAKMGTTDRSNNSATGSSSSDDDSDDSSKSSDDDDKQQSRADALDTDVGFEWFNSKPDKKKDKNAESSDDESSGDDSDDEDNAKPGSSHKSRKKQVQRRKEERETSRRETALADGTADENPEVAADFERLLAGSPNSSELWIRFMAFYLSVADVTGARAVAERAFQRIEFREEKEKLNVWTALLTLELKYGDSGSLRKAMDRACQQNNPKHVHLRVCELLAKEVESNTSPDIIARADEMFLKMCKKFKSKKQVWIAYVQFLLKNERQQEAHALLKRALLSLPTYKHVEAMTRFAQLEFELGSPERARTLFDGIIVKHPKRLDLLFVYLDKEVKFGNVSLARKAVQKTVSTAGGGKQKLSDKQMKSLFKKWYRMEEEYGNEESCEHVKEAARAYVERTSGS